MKKPTAAIKRLINYLEHPEKYFVTLGGIGVIRYWDVIEVGKGVIDSIQKRTMNKAIEDGFVTYQQLEDSGKL